MADPAEDAYLTLELIDLDARNNMAPKAGKRVDDFQRQMWSRIANRKMGVSEINETGLGDEIGTGEITKGFKTDAGTEIWLQQPIGTTTTGKDFIVDGINVDQQSNVDQMFVKYTKKGAKVVEIELIGMDNHSYAPSVSSSAEEHFAKKKKIMEVWRRRFKTKFPDAAVKVFFNEEDQVFWRDTIKQIEKIEQEAEIAVAMEDAALAGKLDAQLLTEAEKVEARSLLIAEINAPEVIRPLAKELFSVVGVAASLGGIALKGKEMTDLEMKLYKSPTLHALMVAIKNGDTRRIDSLTTKIKEYTRPDIVPVVEDFVKLGGGILSAPAYQDAWPAFVDQLVELWKNAAAAARTRVQKSR